MQVHPSQIEPAQPFDIFYFLRNHTDSTTYYVRAVIYDIKTGEVLRTVNLDQSPTNARIYSKTLDAPPDPIGYGRNIVSVATVYTNSGYSSKSQDYEEQEQYFLVKAAPPVFGGGGGIDYRIIDEMFQDGFKKALKANRPPKADAVPYETIYGAIGALQREVNRIPKDVSDFSPIAEQVANLQKTIEAIPQPEAVDLSPVFSAIDALSGTIDQISRDMKLSGAALLSQHRELIGKLSTDVLARVETGVREMMSKQELTIPLEKLFREQKPADAPAPDMSHLM